MRAAKSGLGNLDGRRHPLLVLDDCSLATVDFPLCDSRFDRAAAAEESFTGLAKRSGEHITGC